MLQVLHPAYSFSIVVHDRDKPQTLGGSGGMVVGAIGGGAPYKPYKFQDAPNGKTGCDEALAAVKDALAKAGLECDVMFTGFDQKA